MSRFYANDLLCCKIVPLLINSNTVPYKHSFMDVLTTYNNHTT